MSTNQPNTLGHREIETRLLWAIVASGIVHAAAIVGVVVIPGYWPKRATPSVSYTVELIASAEPAGTNLPSGSAPVRPVAPAPAKPVAPAQPEPVEPAPAPVRVPEAPPVEQPAKPSAVEKPPVAPPVEKPPPIEVPPKQPPAKAEPVPAQKADVKLASKTMKPTPVKAQEPPPTRGVPKPTVGKPTAAVARNPTPVAASTAVTREASKEVARDEQIAAAVQRRAQDQKIAEAVQRRAAAAQQTPASAGAGGPAAAGPVSLGQGTGSGGVVEGLDMILYRGQMERRIKENWVWAGEDLALEVKIQFDVTPSGEIKNVRVAGSSGNPSYDASAERAVRAASPLAPPPEKYRDLFVNGVEITFRPQDLQS